MTRRRGASHRLLDPLALEARQLLTTLIAVIDSGIDLNDASVVPYLDLSSAYDAYNKKTYAEAGAAAVLDTSLAHGHGSVVANMTVQGIVAAAGPSGRSPDVKIMPIRDTSSGLNIDPSAVIRGVYWAADHGASVINLSVNLSYNPSLYDPGDARHGSTLVDAIQYAEAKGAVVVTAPGNASRNIDLIPVFPPYADDPLYSFTRPTPTNVLVAAAVDASGKLTPPSSYGPIHVDLGAYAGPEGFTSYSAAYASGVTGVVHELMPAGASARQVLDVVEATVTPQSQGVGAWSKTGGVLNPAAAVARALQGTPTAADGTILIDAGSASDAYFQGGSATSTSATIDVGGVESPPPGPVFQNGRSGASFTYRVNGLTPGAKYHVRLDFAETAYNGPGQRLFDVLVNGATQIFSIDLYAAAGGKDKAVARDLIVQADGSGTIRLDFKGVKGEAKVDALEIRPATNLAAGKPATSSSIESWSYNPALAVDFSSSSRWSSGQWMQGTSTGWYAVDLQDYYRITDVQLNWERAYAVDYQIQVSDDGQAWTTIKTVTGNQSQGSVVLSGLSGEGRFIRVYCTRTSAGANNYSLFDFRVSGSRLDDLAEGKAATTSSTEGPGYGASQAFDDDGTTRWSSGQWMQGSSSAWISVDLGAISAIRDVRLAWEAAFASSYDIQVSVDGKTWTTLKAVRDGAAGPAYFADLGGVGRYVRVLCNQTGPVHNNYSLYDFNVYGSPLSNLATGKVATSSTNESNFYAPSMAIDGNLASRWSSGQWMQPGSTAWLAIDLGARYDLATVSLNWEAAYAVDYQIQVSDDGQAWTTIRSVTGRDRAGVDVQSGLSGSGRFVRILGTKMNATKNYSLYDVQVFGVPSAAAGDSGWSTWTAVAAAPIATAPIEPTPDVAPARPPFRRAVAPAGFVARHPRDVSPAAFSPEAGRPRLPRPR